MLEFIPFFMNLKWIVLLIAFDWVLGLVVSLMKKEFRLGKVANFMVRPVLGYLWGFAVLEMVAAAIPSMAMMVQAAYYLIILALVGSILNHLGKLGLPIPAMLKKE